jgi:hypothetical protein
MLDDIFSDGLLGLTAQILKHAYEILEKSDDNREKLQAMELFKDTHLVKLELLSNATTIDSALNYIRSKQQEEHQHKRLALDSTTRDDSNNSDDDQLTTTFLKHYGPKQN